MIIIRSSLDSVERIDMKKVWLILLLVVFLTAGCNLPYGQAQLSPTPDLIATQVAALSTPPVNPTPIILTSAPTDQLPASPTATTRPTETLAPTSTQTSSPDDPRVQLGTPTYIEKFDNGKSFGLDSKAYDDDYTYIRVENGALILTSRYATGYRGWRTGGTKLGNAYLEGNFKVGDCSGSDQYGMVFRSPDFIKGYWFQVTCAGNWELGYWIGTDYSSLKSGTNSGNILLTGSNQTNRLGVWTSGSQIKLYINGKLISEVDDSSQTEAGSFGAVIASYNTPNFTVTIDDFTYWKLD